MWSAFVGATFYHFLIIYSETVAEYVAQIPFPVPGFAALLADSVRERATEVGKVMVVVWFIGYAFYTNDIFGLRKKAAAVPSTSNKYYIQNNTLKTVKKE
mmetsp:Transcript_26792/g.27235  ORF Transcript_26792/g.27235 Transcript_26792/m.27235 type:complete len:100 (+) Transcript_26792:302-601(+)